MSAGDQCPGNVREGGHRVGIEHDAAAREGEIEAVLAEVGGLDVGLNEAKVGELAGSGPAAGLAEHARRQVDADHLAGRHQRRKVEGGRAHATPNVEHPVAGSRVEPPDDCVPK